MKKKPTLLIAAVSACAAVATVAVLFLSSCQVVSLTAFEITSLFNDSFTPGQAVTINIDNGSGYNVPVNTTVTTPGQVDVAIPPYFDPASGLSAAQALTASFGGQTLSQFTVNGLASATRRWAA